MESHPKLISSRFVPSDGLHSVDSCPNSEYFNRLVLVRTRPAGGFDSMTVENPGNLCDTTILLQMTLRAYSTYPLLCLDLLLGIVFDSRVSSVVLLMIGQLDRSLRWLQANGVASQVDIKSFRTLGWFALSRFVPKF